MKMLKSLAAVTFGLYACSSSSTGKVVPKDASSEDGLDDVPTSVDSAKAEPDSPRAPDSPVFEDSASSRNVDVTDSPGIVEDAATKLDSRDDIDVAGDALAGPIIDVGRSPLDTATLDVGASTLSNGLVSWWRCDGNAFDSKGINNGTLQGGMAFVDGRLGQACQFNGTDTTVTVKSSSTLAVDRAFTLAFWVRIHTIPSYTIVVLRKLVVGSEDKNVTITPEGRIGFYLFNVMNGVALYSNAALSVDAWHHVAATYDGTKTKIYLDGRLDGSATAGGSVANGTGPLIFGQSLDFPYFAGGLDEIRWYARSLTETEVASLASGGT